MVKIFICANFQSNATALTATVTQRKTLNPAQAAAAPGEDDQHLTIGADADLTQAPTIDLPPMVATHRLATGSRSSRWVTASRHRQGQFHVGVNRQDAKLPPEAPSKPSKRWV